MQGDLRGAIQRLCPKAVVREELGILETETEPAAVVEQWLSRNEVKLSVAVRVALLCCIKPSGCGRGAKPP